MSRVRVSKQAEADLDAIWEYVAEQRSMETATRLIESITDTFLVLGRQPGVGRRRHEFEPGVRSFPVGNYIIYYRQRPGSIEISHVIHGRRDQEKAWRAEDNE